MKKVFALFLVSLLLLLTACSGSNEKAQTESGDSKDPNELTIWTWDPNFNVKAMNLAAEAYQGDNPDFKIKIIENAQEDVVQKLNTSLSSGTTKGLPNIVLIEDYRAQSFLQAYPDAFHELTDVFNTEDFASYKLGPTSLDGKVYGLPFDSGVTGLYVRTDYLSEAGYTVEDLNNADWDKYIEIGKAVKEKTGKFMLSLDPNDMGIVRIMVQSAGSWFTEEDGVTPQLAGNEALKKSFEVYKKLIEADIARPISDWNQLLEGFNSGEVASVPTGNWITASVKAEASQSGKWAVAPIPKLPGMDSSVNASNLGGSSWYVLDVPGKEKAADFLAKTFGSNADFYQTLVTEIGAIGTYIPAAEGEAYKAADEFFGGQATVTDFSAWTEEIPRINYGLHTYAIEDILVVEMQNYLNGKEVDQVLEDAQAQAEAQLK
ncbi:extracellular solute-binding protein [Metabacillus halosaccharovorans]|uniref:Extracellular solute-binding protein n=1 Tax=Metabacillus halosaccharovorans TaxID=930124 RepID=A0ABT3DJS2_9BACI|nr:extracellular solute-binding protein [Metabacillus halosaccharovorans]MCV9887300.1 extracellular solute-binding protein [Metabacillus halosaccharovorans]